VGVAHLRANCSEYCLLLCDDFAVATTENDRIPQEARDANVLRRIVGFCAEFIFCVLFLFEVSFLRK
jgi:hypothetical protein